MTPAELRKLVEEIQQRQRNHSAECIGSAMRLLAKPFHLMCGAGNLVLLEVGQRVSSIVGPILEQGVRE
jgi:hypothetical protein